jgi:uncharacterized protein (TIGR02118 family)
MVKLVGLIQKRSDISDTAFREHWLTVHAEIARTFPGLRRYTVNFIDRAQHPGSAYDGFSELWFDSQDALDAAFAGPVGQRIAADIPIFMHSLTRVMVEEHVLL